MQRMVSSRFIIDSLAQYRRSWNCGQPCWCLPGVGVVISGQMHCRPRPGHDEAFHHPLPAPGRHLLTVQGSVPRLYSLTASLF